MRRCLDYQRLRPVDIAVLLGTASVTTDGAGDASFAETLATAATAGEIPGLSSRFLDNGLEVIVVENHAVPLVTIDGEQIESEKARIAAPLVTLLAVGHPPCFFNDSFPIFRTIEKATAFIAFVTLATFRIHFACFFLGTILLAVALHKRTRADVVLDDEVADLQEGGHAPGPENASAGSTPTASLAPK